MSVTPQERAQVLYLYHVEAVSLVLISRMTGLSVSAVEGVVRKEVVIENDIGWRVDTMVDYLFGKPLVIASAAVDPARREAIGRLLRTILANNGGIGFLQQLALFGAVYGFADVLVKVVPSTSSGQGGCGTSALAEAPVSEKSSSDGYRTSETRAGAEPARNSQLEVTGCAEQARAMNSACVGICSAIRR